MFINHSSGKKTYLSLAGNPEDIPLLLLHGIGADHLMWEPQIDWFADRGFHVLAPDLLGHGQSSRVEKLSLDDWEDQLSGILESLEIKKSILIGASMGGVIAQSFTAKFPEKVIKLVLADTFGEIKTLQERILGSSQVIGYRLYKLLGGEALSRGMASAYKAPHASRAREYFMQASLNADFDQLILARKAINQADLIGKIDGIRIPTLVLVGADFGRAFIKINQKISESIKGSRLMVLDNAMDPSNLVNPDRFNSEVHQFMVS